MRTLDVVVDEDQDRLVVRIEPRPNGCRRSCLVPEVKRLGKTLKQWADPLLAYFDTGGAFNGDTEAVNGLIELHQRSARRFRNYNNYRLRALLIAGGLIS